MMCGTVPFWSECFAVNFFPAMMSSQSLSLATMADYGEEYEDGYFH